LLPLLAGTKVEVSQHYITIVIVVHSVFLLGIFNAVELFPFFILSPLLDDPPIQRIFLLLFLLFVLLNEADVQDDTPNYLLLAFVVAEDAVLLAVVLPQFPYLARATHLRQCHPTT